HKVSIQVAARELRYAWFEELLQQDWPSLTPHGSPLTLLYSPNTGSRLLTAHHRDDAIETVLLNFFKGTGISGLTGIPAENGRVLRPLLFASREQLESRAREKGLSWREDSSNSETKYTRNALRHEVLPLLEKLFPQVRQNLARNMTRFAGVEAVYRSSVELQLSKMLEWNGAEARLPVRKALKTPVVDTLLFELARPFGFTPAQTEGLHRLLESEPGRYIDSRTHRALRHGAWLLFSPLQQEPATIYVLEKGVTERLVAGRLLTVTELPAPPDTLPADPSVALLDACHIQYPLLLRRWKAGDYFYPLGMRKKKKLARFFIDAKLSKSAKEDVWVIESHKRIVWVAGLRIDDRFKITTGTRKVLRLDLGPATGSGNSAPAPQSSEAPGNRKAGKPQ
ncbi:MAG: tRNA lysidine(34) synthetase TilS, partial [Sphingobacteriales bacterium]